jgi:hypothetical protein
MEDATGDIFLHAWDASRLRNEKTALPPHPGSKAVIEKI